MAGKQESELAEALRNSVLDVQIAGKNLRLHKWTWRKGLEHGDKFIRAVGDVVKGKDLAQLMKQDVLHVLKNQAEIMATILVDTIITDNFADRAAAEEWFNSLALDEVVKLLSCIMKQNYVPLREAFSELKRVVVESSGNQTK